MQRAPHERQRGVRGCASYRPHRLGGREKGREAQSGTQRYARRPVRARVASYVLIDMTTTPESSSARRSVANGRASGETSPRSQDADRQARHICRGRRRRYVNRRVGRRRTVSAAMRVRVFSERDTACGNVAQSDYARTDRARSGEASCPRETSVIIRVITRRSEELESRERATSASRCTCAKRRMGFSPNAQGRERVA